MSTLPQTSTDEAARSNSHELAAAAVEQVVPRSLMWWKIGDIAVLSVYASVVLWTIQYHEKWADEAQAWLLARDLSLSTLWLKELRYEGTPGLWHTILWIAQRAFHARYDSISYIGAAFAIVGVGFMLFKAPFPRPLRWMLAFTYFMVYQYAVIARHYTLFPLLVFAAAYFFSDLEHPERITLVLVLLANLTTHGSILALCLGVAYAVRTLKAWPNLNDGARHRFILSAGVILLTFLCLFIVLRPPPDVEALNATQELTHRVVIGYLLNAISGPFFDYALPSAIFLLLAGIWCAWRREFVVFILPLLLLVPFYVYVRGWPHQQGTIFLAVMAAIWIAWPKNEEQKNFSQPERLSYRGMIALLICLFAYQAWNAGVIIKHDYKFPYSGAEDAANYLKSVHAERGPIFGYLYGVVAVQAYFDHNILVNYPTAYFHHSTSSLAASLDPGELRKLNPEYILVPSWSEPDRVYRQLYRPMMSNLGYALVHVSDGYLLTKRGWKDRQVYFIFRRVTREPSSKQAH